MSSADEYKPVRATARTWNDRKVGWLSMVHPDLWDDQPALRGCIMRDLDRVAEAHLDVVRSSTLTIELLHPLPGFEHLVPKVTDPPVWQFPGTSAFDREETP